MFKFFVILDIEEIEEKYDKIYEEAEYYELTRFIPARFTRNEENILLPKFALYGIIENKDKNKAQKLMIEKVRNIYFKLKLKGSFTVICSNGSFTTKI